MTSNLLSLLSIMELDEFVDGKGHPYLQSSSKLYTPKARIDSS